MPQVGFELKTSVFERAKTVLVLDRAANDIGFSPVTVPFILLEWSCHQSYVLVHANVVSRVFVCIQRRGSHSHRSYQIEHSSVSTALRVRGWEVLQSCNQLASGSFT
jgi:hypothetical protein